MSKEKFENRSRRKFGTKSLALMLALVLLVGSVIGGTLAWLTASSSDVKNVFTTSDISVTLQEGTNTYQMIPGWTIAKDPSVTVKKDSEDCWLFVKVDEACNVTVGTTTYNFDDFIVYAIDSGWTQGKGTGEGGDGIPTNVYYRKVENVTTDVTYTILGAGTTEDEQYSWSANQVLTLPTVTKEMMKAADETSATKPTLTFTAYASQLYKSNKPTTGDITTAQFSVADAWKNVSSSN